MATNIPITDEQIEIAVPSTNTGTPSDRPNRALTQALLKQLNQNIEAATENSVSPFTAIIAGKGLTGTGTLEENVTISAVMTDSYALNDESVIASAKALFDLYALYLSTQKYMGRFLSLVNLMSEYPTAPSGAYAVVNSGLGEADTFYLYSVGTASWVVMGSGEGGGGEPTVPLTPQQIKLLYELNDNTNAFTDDYKLLVDTLVDEAITLASEVGYSEELGMTQLAITTELLNKVDKVIGKDLSDENFTDLLKQKLLAIEDPHFKGSFPSLLHLTDAYPVGIVGDFADVDNGVDIVRYVWDETNQEWEPRVGVSTELTPVQIKQYYESNLDTNVFDDDAKDKLANIEPEATKNLPDEHLLDRTKHNGKIAITDVTDLNSRLTSLETEKDCCVDINTLTALTPEQVLGTDTFIIYKGDMPYKVSIATLRTVFGAIDPIDPISQLTSDTGKLIVSDSNTPVTY